MEKTKKGIKMSESKTDYSHNNQFCKYKHFIIRYLYRNET
jgi:hypothetical protein